MQTRTRRNVFHISVKYLPTCKRKGSDHCITKLDNGNHLFATKSDEANLSFLAVLNAST